LNLSGKHILVVGLGGSGLAAARLCLAKGAEVRATDQNPQPKGADELASAGAKLTLGGHSTEDFDWAEIIVLSPGVDPRRPEIAEAGSMGKQILGELELGFRFLKSPSVMITGTNGKSSVTTLIGDMLRRAGMKVFVGGNLGDPLCGFVLRNEDVDWAVLEVSSFQCDTADTLSPRVGVLLNITPDHMDRYDEFKDYADSKFSIFKRQSSKDSAVFLAGDTEIERRASGCAARKWWFAPEGDLRPGGHIEDKELVITPADGRTRRIDTSGARLGGSLMRLNYLAASLSATICRAPADAIKKAIIAFEGLPHRLQHVGELDGVDYINDSKGTNLGAVMAALEAMTRPVILLLGGQDKKGDFSQLLPYMGDKVRAVVCFGQGGPGISEQLKGSGQISLVPDVESAFKKARGLAKPGQAVLLSPGCTSWDAYDNYGQRGYHFRDLVREAAGE
jgi:UDP-N-acetylmuramoylalanine--D-glutamate ligase